MAGSKLKLTGRVKASGILEVIISMIVILLVFSIAMMISANVMRSSLSVKKINAQALVHEILVETEQSKESITQTFTLEDIRVEQEVKPYEGAPDLLEIHIIAYDANQDKLAELQKVIINKHE